MQNIDRVLSLGTTCETAFQIRRIFGNHACISGVFDYQITPPNTVIEYLQRDFTGLLERDDLREVEGVVRNERFRTQHMHEFRSGSVDADFSFSRSRHDHLCDNVRTALKGTEKLLLVITLPKDHQWISGEICRLIEDTNKNLEFFLEVVQRRSVPELISNWQGDDKKWTEILSKYSARPEGLTNFVHRQAKRFASHITSKRF